MVYLLKMVIFHGKLLNNQVVYLYIYLYGLNKNTSTRAAGNETFACPTLETEPRRCAGADFVNEGNQARYVF